MPESFTFEEAIGPESFSFEEAQKQVPQTTALGAFARSAATSIFPSAAFGAASRVGVPVSAVATPWVGVPTGLAAGVGAGMGASWLQEKALQVVAPEIAKELATLQAADIEQHPWASATGRLIGGVGGFRLAPGKVLKLPPAQAAAQIGTGAAIGVGLPVAVEAVKTGELRVPTLPEVAEAAAFPLLYGAPRGTRAPVQPSPPRAARVTVEPPVETQPITEASRLLRGPEPPVVEAEPVRTEAAQAAVEPPAPIEPIRQQAPPVPPPQIEGAQPRTQIEGPSARKGGIIEPYSTPMIERLDAVGGPESRRVAAEARQIDSRSAELAGSISQSVDTARTLASKLARGGTTWIRGTVQVTPKTFIGRLHGLEGLDRQVVVNSVPPVAQEMVGAIWDANVPGIGGLAAQANVGFAPQGKIQRILTAEGMDVLRSGKSNPVRNEWIKGTAVASNMPEPAIRRIWDDFKAELDKPTPDTARLNAIAQDFQRNIPRMVTHVRVGPRKVELIESDPVNYLNKATERTARAAAFREVYPNTPAGKQRLATTREAVQKELDTSLYPNEFDNLIKVLQGHQLDVSPGQAARLGSTPGLLVRGAARVIAQPMRAGMLSLSALANAAETLAGGPAAFLGFKNVLRVLTKNPIRYRKQLEMAGDLNAVTRNVAFNLNNPLESLSRILSEGVNRLTLNRFLNEAQEYTGAAASRILSDRVRAGDLTPGEVKDFESTLRAAGFRDNFEAIAAGRDAQGLAQFERKAAPFLSAGYERPPIVSRWANSRAFNALFWFHRYPQMVVNQLRGILNNIVEDVRPETRSGARLYRDAKLLVKFLGVKTAQGILANYIIALIKERWAGVEQQTREAKEAPGAFVAQALLTALGGPFTIAMRFGQRVETGEQAGLEAFKLSAPISAAMDSVNAFAGTGRYQGLDPFDRATRFIESKTPAAPVAKSMLAIAGLGHDKPQMRIARNAFYRWARDRGWKFEQSGQTKDAQFTAGMKRVVREMEHGAKWQDTLRAVLAEKKAADPLQSAAQSLEQRKILKNQFGAALNAEEITSLRQWLGEENFKILMQRDAMVDALADALK